MGTVQFGVLIPHFTQFASRTGILESAHVAEDLGFDSVWVRDHLYISPYHTEHAGITDSGLLTESTLTLAALVGVTSRIKLGTAVLTPHRHPLKVAQIFATLSYLSNGRTILGIGAGYDKNEFSTIGIPFEQRFQAVRETVEICRRCWSEDRVSYDGRLFSFREVSINPKPLGKSVPVWYGGLTYKSVERAVEFADGWMPSRIPFVKLDARIRYCKDLRREQGKNAPFDFAVMPQTVVGRSADAALRSVDMNKVKQDALRYKLVKEEGSEISLESLKGFLIWGTAGDMCRFVERFVELGVGHIVFDMRSSFQLFFDNLRFLGKGVLPQFR